MSSSRGHGIALFAKYRVQSVKETDEGGVQLRLSYVGGTPSALLITVYVRHRRRLDSQEFLATPSRRGRGIKLQVLGRREL
jgi:hypothetical protein